MRRLPLRSPPRMRGKVRLLRPEVHKLGITPACAGKSKGSRAAKSVQRDHPRVCGEKHIRVVCGSAGVGSPPRMRGKAGRIGRHSRPERITTAYAGKSLEKKYKEINAEDHPRVCGEKPDQLPGGFWDAGITPAYAGKSA